MLKRETDTTPWISKAIRVTWQGIIIPIIVLTTLDLNPVNTSVQLYNIFFTHFDLVFLFLAFHEIFCSFLLEISSFIALTSIVSKFTKIDFHAPNSAQANNESIQKRNEIFTQLWLSLVFDHKIQLRVCVYFVVMCLFV